MSVIDVTEPHGETEEWPSKVKVQQHQTKQGGQYDVIHRLLVNYSK